MSEHVQREKVTNNKGDVVTKTTEVVDDERPLASETGQAERDTTGTRVVWYFAGVLLVLLGFRFVLILLGANPGNAFAHFIYSLSYPFAAPFFGLFGYELHYGVSRFELSTLIAIAVYALVAYGISRLLTIKRP